MAGAALMTITAVGETQALGFATYFAVLGGNGTVATSSGVASSVRTGPGVYEVAFNRPIVGCALVATINGAKAGFASVAHKAGSPTTVTVSTFTTRGVASNLPFTVLITCNS